MGSNNGGRVMIAGIIIEVAETPLRVVGDATPHLLKHGHACLTSDQCLW